MSHADLGRHVDRVRVYEVGTQRERFADVECHESDDGLLRLRLSDGRSFVVDVAQVGACAAYGSVLVV